MKKKQKTVRRMALSDIAEELGGDGLSAYKLDTKETRKLNKLLGIKNINYFDNKNR